MTTPPATALERLQRQLRELDALAKQTLTDLNTVAGTERVAKWRTATIAVLTESVGAQEAKTFAEIHPGHCFTNDMVEEFTDLIDCYRTPLAALIHRFSRPSPLPPVHGA